MTGPQVRKGRFAPTPSGPLHFGSLLAAVASYCQIKSVNGQWLLRIEDVDTPRTVKGSADIILSTLDTFGFEWESEVIYQSQRFDFYENALQLLTKINQTFACSCSRKGLKKGYLNYGPLGYIYPGFCRNKNLYTNSDHSLRLNMQQAGVTQFNDALFGLRKLDLSYEVGDIVLKRIDGIYAYHLAVIIDDADQNITDIVRGADLLDVTHVHLHLNSLLNFKNADYLHIPLFNNPDGSKLSKQTGAVGIDPRQASSLLVRALSLLGQQIEDDMTTALPREILEYAVQNWDSVKIPLALE